MALGRRFFIVARNRPVRPSVLYGALEVDGDMKTIGRNNSPILRRSRRAVEPAGPPATV